MKWLRADKFNIVVMALVILNAFTIHLFFVSPSTLENSLKEDNNHFQLGFYDLQSRNKEIYDSNLHTINGTTFSTITSPNDYRFVFKGKFTKSHLINKKTYFHMTPIYYSSPQQGLMIDGLVEMLLHTSFWMAPVKSSPVHVVVGQSGSIFICNKTKSRKLNHLHDQSLK